MHSATPQGARLSNTEVLSDLSKYLYHLSREQCCYLEKLLCEFPSLFNDVPSQISAIFLTNPVPIKKRAHQVNSTKMETMRKEVNYLHKMVLQNVSRNSVSSEQWKPSFELSSSFHLLQWTPLAGDQCISPHLFLPLTSFINWEGWIQNQKLWVFSGNLSTSHTRWHMCCLLYFRPLISFTPYVWRHIFILFTPYIFMPYQKPCLTTGMVSVSTSLDDIEN